MDELEQDSPSRVTFVLAFVLAAYALYWAVAYVETHLYRISFLLLVLLITFLSGAGKRTRMTKAIDAMLIAVSLVSLLWPLVDLDAFVHRAATPGSADVVFGILTILVVLEATRRTTGWVLPITALLFLAYGYYGSLLDRIGLDLIAHRGYSIERLIGTLYMTLEGIFGVPLDVTATYIILFTIYGAVLQHSGAVARAADGGHRPVDEEAAGAAVLGTAP